MNLFSQITLTEFIETYNVPGAVVLLAGKRKVSEKDQPKLESLGKLLAERCPNANFRSGNADGADYFFSKGVAAVDADRLQSVLPYAGHRKTKNVAGYSISMDDVSVVHEPELVYQSKLNKGTNKLIDPFVAGKRDRFSMKASYILRDTLMVIGSADVPKATVALFWEDLDAPEKGGTGHTMHICDVNEVPRFDQRTWMSWLEE